MSGGVLHIELGWPAKELSPNTPVHYMKLNRFKNAAKTEAGWATKFAIQNDRDWEPAAETVSVNLIAHPPKHWNTGDRDNFAARCKAHLDGIANALGINDKHFGSPTVTWADKTEHGKLIVSIG